MWRTVTYEEVCLKAYTDAGEARRELGAYFQFYNDRTPHQALGYRTPAEVYQQAKNVPGEAPKGKEVFTRAYVDIIGGSGKALT